MRNIPSPEQGASTRMRSKKAGRAAAIRSGLSLSTTALDTPIRSRLLFRISARAATYSLATSSPCPARADASWLVLPPGAAHRSSTRIPGRTPQQGGRRRSRGFLGVEHPRVVPGMAPRLKARFGHHKARGAERGRLQSKARPGPESLGAHPQRRDGHAPGRLCARRSVQPVIAFSQQGPLPGFKIFCWHRIPPFHCQKSLNIAAPFGQTITSGGKSPCRQATSSRSNIRKEQSHHGKSQQTTARPSPAARTTPARPATAAPSTPHPTSTSIPTSTPRAQMTRARRTPRAPRPAAKTAADPSLQRGRNVLFLPLILQS